jgi:WD40 repeat protein
MTATNSNRLSKNKREREGISRKTKTLLNKSHKLGKLPSVDVALIIYNRGRYFTYKSTDRESFRSHDKTVRLWDAATGNALQTLEGHSDSVSSVAFSPDRNLLATLRVSDSWVVEGKANILWLPPDYRSTCEAIWDQTIVLGHSSGRLSFLQFRRGLKLIV